MRRRVEQKLELDLVLDGRSIRCELGDLGLQAPCLSHCTSVHGNLPPAQGAVEGRGAAVVVGGDQPQSPAPASSGQIHDGPDELPPDTGAPRHGDQDHDLALPVFEAMLEQTHRLAGGLCDEPAKLARIMDTPPRHDPR